MKRPDILFLQNTLETIEAELEQLLLTKEWFSSDCIEMIQNSKVILKQELETDE